MNQLLATTIIVFSTITGLSAQRLDMVWPTPNTAYLQGRPLEEYIQPTASGEVSSGLFGCRRSAGRQFHEALDLKPLKRDKRGEATDPVFAVMNGVVRHASRNPGGSNYGRYIVLEHPDVEPAIYTLYAHLAEIAPEIVVGAVVTGGQTLGVMGRSSSEQAIPRERAHLHFEMGVVLSHSFQNWYDARGFGNRNQHGLYNGMNLLGFDPLEFYDQYRAHRVDTFREFFGNMRQAVRLRIATPRIPDYVQRYPSLLARPMPENTLLGGWEIRFNEMGLPFSFTPLPPMEMMSMPMGGIQVLDADEALLKQNRCQSLLVRKQGRWVPGRDLNEVLQLLFGL